MTSAQSAIFSSEALLFLPKSITDLKSFHWAWDLWVTQSEGPSTWLNVPLSPFWSSYYFLNKEPAFAFCMGSQEEVGSCLPCRSERDRREEHREQTQTGSSRLSRKEQVPGVLQSVLCKVKQLHRPQQYVVGHATQNYWNIIGEEPVLHASNSGPLWKTGQERLCS